MKSTKLIALSLLVSIIAPLGSCGDSGSGSKDTSAPSADSTTAAADGYVFADLDCAGEDFTILNSTTTWGFYTNIDLAEQTGESLDDAVYNRNRTAEDHFNFRMKVVEDTIDEVPNKYQTAILSNDNVYDVAFVRSDRMAPFITEGYLHNLLEYPEFQLDEDYWDHSVTDVAKIGAGDTLYFASTDFSLVGFDGTLCIYFNENMLEELGLEAPYSLVRDGKWTMDKLSEYIRKGANLNGDHNFTWDSTGNATYGLTSWAASVGAFLIGSGERYIVSDDKGNPTLGVENARFYDVADKIVEMFGAEGDFLAQNGSDNDHYEMIFKNSRAMFMAAEIKAMSKYRNMNDNFGIVPMPKYDEAQDRYYSYRTPAALMMSVPVTNSNPERTGIIMDALTYLSVEKVLPIYYDVNLSQKGLRNEDSIEMLGIIRDSRVFDIGDVYGWCTDLVSAVNTAISSGNTGIASLIATHKPAITSSIAATMAVIE